GRVGPSQAARDDPAAPDVLLYEFPRPHPLAYESQSWGRKGVADRIREEGDSKRRCHEPIFRLVDSEDQARDTVGRPLEQPGSAAAAARRASKLQETRSAAAVCRSSWFGVTHQPPAACFVCWRTRYRR